MTIARKCDGCGEYAAGPWDEWLTVTANKALSDEGNRHDIFSAYLRGENPGRTWHVCSIACLPALAFAQVEETEAS